MDKEKDLIEKTFQQMNAVFTSNDFCEKAKLNGIDPMYLINGTHRVWLQDKCIRKSRRIWQKIDTKHSTNNHIQEKLSLDDSGDKNQLLIESAISLLKKNGYKIMKPLTDWKEI